MHTSFIVCAIGREAAWILPPRLILIVDTTTNFLYDGSNLIQELNAGNVATANLLTGLGIDEVYSRTDLLGTQSFLSDALGSTIAMSDSAGAVAASYTYEPYGKSTKTGTTSNTQTYTGREDVGTGLYYYRARYYHPTLSRFISEDPLGIAAGPNVYAYVDGDPISNADPIGLNPGTAIGAGIGSFVMPGPGTVVGAVIGIGVGVGYLIFSKPDPLAPAGGAEHTSGARPSTEGTHQAGDARKRQDRGREKGDDARDDPRRRPDGWKGPWPPKPKTPDACQK